MNMIGRSFKALAAVTITASSVCAYKRLISSSATLHAQNAEGTTWFDLFASKYNKLYSKDNIDEILRRQEYTGKIKRKNFEPVAWFETNHYNANNPIEDRHCECHLDLSNGYFFGVFDGHSGWHCAESLRLRLPIYMSLAVATEEQRSRYINGELKSSELVKHMGNPNDDCHSFEFPENFKEKQKRVNTGSIAFAKRCENTLVNLSKSGVLKFTYLSMDNDINKEAIPDGKCNEPIWNGMSGAVVIGAYINDHDLYVASTGDCRAVLGVKGSSSYYDVAMSEDHTTDNIKEVERIKKEHPNEMYAVFNGRLLGQLQPLRSFGDVMYKWSIELHHEVLNKLTGHPLVAKHIYLTPPYLTAKPDITHKRIESDDRFVIMATDGLWETVSNEVAVKIVGKYLDDLEKGIRHTENAATKLIRYALGQNDSNLLSQIVGLPPDVKRNYHDDITVTIIFFDAGCKYLKSKL